MRRRLERFLTALTGRGARADADATARAVPAVAALEDDVGRFERDAAGLRERIAALHARTEQMVTDEAARLDDLASLAAVPAARLRSRLLTLDGPPSRRLATARHVIGTPVTLPLEPWLGMTACVTETPEVRELWERLMATEAACEDVLRGGPGTVLELTDALVWKDDRLHVSLREPAAAAGGPRQVEVAIVPRFAYDFPPRKARNFGHWLIDCMPHVLALASLAPSGRFLLPAPYRDAHWSALALTGVPAEQVIAWDGTPVRCRHLFVEEADGRVARGRPLPLLADLRRRFLAAPARGIERDGRRIYVSRRDAKTHRQWMSNHDEVEALFRSRGFDVLVMRAHSLDEQVAIFRGARVVAGISGAGLTNILFADPGIHVITLLTDSLMRWYAEERGSRSTWAAGRLPMGSPLNELSDSPRFYAHLAAACEQHSHTFVCEDAVPVERLAPFLDNVLRGANA